MKRYVGARFSFGQRVWVVDGDITRQLDPRFDLRKHSPDGFNWGYGGSGPAQLALAICADALGRDDVAQAVYMDFKRKVIARIDNEEWIMPEEFVQDAIESVLREKIREKISRMCHEQEQGNGIPEGKCPG
jgi:uncharacterized protein DUF6166